MKYDTALPTWLLHQLQLICISSLVFGSSYFSQIPARSKSDTDKKYSKDYIHMNECISESGCVCELILPGSVSLLVVKLWDLVIKKYMLQLFSLEAILLRNHRTVLTIHFRAEWFCARSACDVLCALLSVAYVCALQCSYLYNKLFKTCILPFNFQHSVI